MSQEELAERADLASKMVSLIERFERNPTVNVADSLAHEAPVPGAAAPDTSGRR